MRPDDQMAIGSITKSVIAAQLLQMVVAGEVALDDPATQYLPADFDFDTSQATIRQLWPCRPSTAGEWTAPPRRPTIPR